MDYLIEVNQGDSENITFKVNNYTGAGFSDVIFCLWNGENQLLTKSLTEGSITMVSAKEYSFIITPEDTEGLNVSNNYTYSISVEQGSLYRKTPIKARFFVESYKRPDIGGIVECE